MLMEDLNEIDSSNVMDYFELILTVLEYDDWYDEMILMNDDSIVLSVVMNDERNSMNDANDCYDELYDVNESENEIESVNDLDYCYWSNYVCLIDCCYYFDC